MSKVNIDVSDFLINNNSKRLFDAILQYLTESLRLKSEDESLYCFEDACYGIVCYEGENYLI